MLLGQPNFCAFVQMKVLYADHAKYIMHALEAVFKEITQQKELNLRIFCGSESGAH